MMLMMVVVFLRCSILSGDDNDNDDDGDKDGDYDDGGIRAMFYTA